MSFLNRNLSTSIKAQVFKAICLSIHLYSSQFWTPYRAHIQELLKASTLAFFNKSSDCHNKIEYQYSPAYQEQKYCVPNHSVRDQLDCLCYQDTRRPSPKEYPIDGILRRLTLCWRSETTFERPSESNARTVQY